MPTKKYLMTEEKRRGMTQQFYIFFEANVNLNIYVCIRPVLYVVRIKSLGRNCQPPCLYGNFCITVFHAKNR